MNRKYTGLVAGVVAVAAGVGILVAMSNGSNRTNQSSQLIAGEGEIKQAKRLNGLGAIYNDEYIFFDGTDEVTYRVKISDLDETSNVQMVANCADASCTHDNARCGAYIRLGEYFVFNNKLYKYYNDEIIASGETKNNGHIVEADSGKEVFSNPVPKDMPEEYAVDDSEMIFYVRNLDDKYLKVEGNRHAYLVDKNFNVKYCHYNIGKFPWGAIMDNNYYYVNDIHQLVKVNLDTLYEEPVERLGKIFMADNDEDNIYFSNEQGELHKYSVSEETDKKIADDALMFSVQEEYIYALCVNSNKKLIYDKEGNIMADYTEHDVMGADDIFQIGNRVYTNTSDGVAYMDKDGENYGEIRK